MNIVFASGNVHKLNEMQALLGDQFTLIPQSEFKVPEADETGLTYLENAIIKARNACEYTDFPVLADDSGVSVNALKGEPGIYAARYGGTDISYPEKRALLLKNFADTGSDDRSLYFYCALVLMQHANDPAPMIGLGQWDGEIVLQEKGNNGFGYDSIFYDTHYKMTAAELNPDIKNHLSHRGRAVRDLLKNISGESNDV